MTYHRIWSSADVEALPQSDPGGVQLRALDRDIVDALNSRPPLRCLDVNGDYVADEHVPLLHEIHGLEGVDLFGGKRLSELGFSTILALPGLRRLLLLSAHLSEDSLARLDDCATLEELTFDNTKNVTARVLAAVGRLPRLQCLFLEVWGLPRNAFEPLGALTTLTRLQVDSDPAEADLEPLLTNQRLEFLSLLSWGRTARGPEAARAVEMVWRLGALREFGLSSYVTASESLVGLGNLQHLHTLRCSGNGSVGTAVARRLADLPALFELNLHRTAMTDDGLRHIATLPSLGVLGLGNCPYITASGLRHIASMASLRMLDLRGCKRIGTDEARDLTSGMTDALVVFPDKSRSCDDARQMELLEWLREQRRARRGAR